MIIKKIFTLFLFSALSLSLSAQTMKEIISNMPDSITPLLTKNTRLNFIDYIEANQKAVEKNRLGGESEMTLLNETRCVIKMSGSSTLDIKLLKSPEPSIGIITSVNTKENSTITSIIKYYSLDWKLLKTIIPEDFKGCSWKNDSEEIETVTYDPLKLDNIKFEK